MKIIADTHGGFLVDVSMSEIAMILGFRNATDTAFNKSSIVCGASFDIRKANNAAEFVRTMDTKKLKSIKTSLQNAIDGIDHATDEAKGLRLFEIIQEVGDE